MTKEQVFYPGENYWKTESGKLKLIGVCCKSCNRVYFPSQEMCAGCYDQDNMDKITIGPQGKLYAYSIVHAPSRGFEVPYSVGYADFPNNIRVFAQLTEVDPSKLKVNMNVELVLGKIGNDEDGKEIISYKFKPLEECD